MTLNVVLKRFTKPAKNQTAVLACFEEDGWPELIDDPLTPGRLKTKRLGDTVRALNQDMERSGVVVFKPARLGTAVRWVKKPGREKNQAFAAVDGRSSRRYHDWS